MKKAAGWESLLVLALVLVAYGYFSPNGYTSANGTYSITIDWNANSRFDLVKAVVESHQFEIDYYQRSGYLETGDKAFFNGHMYSDKAIGAALLGIVFYFPVYQLLSSLGYTLSLVVFQELVAFLAVSLTCACLAPLVYSFVKGISGSAGYGLLVTSAICLGTPLYFYSTVFYGHALAGTFLFAAFFLWFQMKQEQKIQPAKTLISGCFLGYAFITEYQTGVIVLLIGAYILYVVWKQRQLLSPKTYILIASGFALPLAAALLYNQVVFHNPFSTGYAYEALSQFSVKQSIGVMGIGLPNLTALFYMTFHTTMGIFWQSPILLLAFVGWAVIGWHNKPYRAEALLSLGIILVYFVIFSGYYFWWGGTAFTPRYVIPALPFFAIPLAFVPRKGLLGALFLTTVSVAQMFLVTASSSSYLDTAIQPFIDGRAVGMFTSSTIYDVYFWNFISHRLTTNRGMEFLGLSSQSSLLPLFIIEAALLIGFSRVSNIFPWSRLGQRLRELARGKETSG